MFSNTVLNKKPLKREVFLSGAENETRTKVFMPLSESAIYVAPAVSRQFPLGEVLYFLNRSEWVPVRARVKICNSLSSTFL